jgi:H/ACA ribonucleoprotein complex subunit 2
MVIHSIPHPCRRLCLIAGDISPIDVITPLPVMCEDRDVPYIYLPSKEELGQAGLTKRPTSCMLILPRPVKGEAPQDDEAKEFGELYAEVRPPAEASWRLLSGG